MAANEAALHGSDVSTSSITTLELHKQVLSWSSMWDQLSSVVRRCALAIEQDIPQVDEPSEQKVLDWLTLGMNQAGAKQRELVDDADRKVSPSDEPDPTLLQ